VGELDKQWREDKQQPPMLRDLLSLPTETTRLIGDGSPNDAPPFHLLPLEIERLPLVRCPIPHRYPLDVDLPVQAQKDQQLGLPVGHMEKFNWIRHGVVPVTESYNRFLAALFYPRFPRCRNAGVVWTGIPNIGVQLGRRDASRRASPNCPTFTVMLHEVKHRVVFPGW